MKTLKKGDVLVWTEGDYSDRCVKGIIKVLVDFDSLAALSEWAEDTGRKVNEHGAVQVSYKDENPESYVEWLVRAGVVRLVPTREFSAGCYGVFMPCISELNE